MATRSKGDGSIFQRADGKWVATLDVGWVGGKRKRRKAVAATRAAAAARLRALKREVEAGVMGADVTTAKWLEHWLTVICPARDLKPSTIYGYRRKLELWVIPRIGKVQLRKLTPDHIRSIHTAMREAGQADATMRQVHAILSRALKVAEQDQRVSRNVASVVDAPSVGQVRHDALTVDEAQAVLKAAPTTRDLARLLCALALGLRRGEALALQWADIDFDAGTMTISEALDWTPGQGGVQVGTPKSRASHRSIPLPDGILTVLAGWRSESVSEWVFPGPDGGPERSSKPDWQRWRDSLALAGVRHVPPHGARASCASVLQRMGVPDVMIAEILGHSQVRVTQTHYLRSDEGQRREALERAWSALQLD